MNFVNRHTTGICFYQLENIRSSLFSIRIRWHHELRPAEETLRGIANLPDLQSYSCSPSLDKYEIGSTRKSYRTQFEP